MNSGNQLNKKDTVKDVKMKFRMNISRKRKEKKKTTCWRTILVQSRSGCGGGSSPSAAFIFPPTTNRTVAAIYNEAHDNNVQYQMCIHFGINRQVP